MRYRNYMEWTSTSATINTRTWKRSCGFLMLIDGKLIDDLSPADDRIRETVARLTDPAAAAAERIEHLARIQDVAAGTTDDRDRALAEFLAGYTSIDADDYNARLAVDIIERGYLDEKPNLAVRG